MLFNIFIADGSTETSSVLVTFFSYHKGGIYCQYVNNVNVLKGQNAIKLFCYQA